MLHVYHIDAFASHLFTGNPAAVVPLHAWRPDSTLQSIAAENNLSETAFFAPAPGRPMTWHLRWFTPSTEVDLCGHATLAAGHVLLRLMHPDLSRVTFTTQSAGELIVEKRGGRLSMDFPSRPPTRVVDAALFDAVRMAIGPQLKELHQSRDLLALFDSADAIRELKPNMPAIAALPAFALIVTAPGDSGSDFVSRFFAPAQGVPEDPVTGSAHCTLVPFWAARLGKSALVARQLSARTGTLYCALRGARIEIAGDAVLYMEGKISL